MRILIVPAVLFSVFQFSSSNDHSFTLNNSRIRYSLPHGSSCLQGDFEAQVQCRLKYLMTSEEMSRASSTCRRLQNTLRTRWEEAVVSPTGSTVTGLATRSSDTDCYADIPGYHSSVQEQIIEDVTNTLKQHPTLYGNVTVKMIYYRTTTLGVFRFFDIVNQQFCEVNIEDYSAPSDSRMRAYYFNLDERFRSLAALIKLWITSLSGKLDSYSRLGYSSELMTIFYLQQSGLAPAFSSLQSRNNGSRFERWDTRFHSAPHNSSSPHSLLELLGGFFRFYSQFNFRDYVISPYAGRPLHRNMFHNVSILPEEFSLYKNYLGSEGSVPLLIDCAICIQRVFTQQRNALDFVNNDKAFAFISAIKHTAKMFDQIQSDEFLKSWPLLRQPTCTRSLRNTLQY